MVRKADKFGFNTGNTVRSFDRQLNSAQLLSTQLISVVSTLNDGEIANETLKLTPHVTYSANRKSRWTLAEIVAERHRLYDRLELDFAEERICITISAKPTLIEAPLKIIQSDYFYFSSTRDSSVQITKLGRIRNGSIEDIQIADYQHQFGKKDRRLQQKTDKRHYKGVCSQCHTKLCLTCVYQENLCCPAYEKTKYLLDTPCTTYQIQQTSIALHQKRTHRAQPEKFTPKHLSDTKSYDHTPTKTYYLRDKTDKFGYFWFTFDCGDSANSVDLHVGHQHNFVGNNNNNNFARRQLEQMYTNQQKISDVKTPNFDLVKESDILRWLERGNIDRLEQLVLEGRGHQLIGRYAVHAKARSFLRSVSEYQDNYHLLQRAIINGNLAKVKDLSGYKSVARLKAKETGRNCLHLAAIWNQSAIFKYLMKKIPDLICHQDIEGKTPLHYAALTIENGEIYSVVQSYEPDELIVDGEGYTADNYRQDPTLLDINSIRGPDQESDSKIKQLLEDPCAPLLLRQMVMDGYGAVIEDYAFPDTMSDLKRSLKALRVKVQLVFEALKDGDEKILHDFLDEKDLIFCRNDKGMTLLMEAVVREREPICLYLTMKAPSLIRETDRAGRTAYHYALNKGNEFGTTIAPTLEPPEKSETSADKSLQIPLNSQKSSTCSSQPPDMTEPICDTPEPNEQDVDRWIRERNFEQLEHLALQGNMDLIKEKAEVFQELANFLKHITDNQKKLDNIDEGIKKGDLRQIRLLMDRKKLACARGTHGRIPLHTAIKYGQTHIVDYLIANFPECVAARDKQRRSALHYAAIFDNQEIYNKLLEAGANPDAIDKDGNVASYYLVEKVAPSIISESGDAQLESLKMNTTADDMNFDEDIDNEEADENDPPPELVNEWLNAGQLDRLEELVLAGKSYLLLTRTSELESVNGFLKTLPQYQTKIDAIHKAVEEGDVRRVKSLIDNPKLALARDRKGATPLHNAVLYGQTDTIRFLVQRFAASINSTDNMDRTPLHYASADRNGGHYIKLLQKAGADAFMEDRLGHTPFYYRSNPMQLNLKSLKDEAVMDQLMMGELPRPLLQDLEEDIIEWLKTGNIGKLEELVLNGYGDLLLGKVQEVDDTDVLSFLEILPQYQAKIRAIHNAVQTGSLRDVKALIDRKKMALCRDNKGATPLHNAILYDQEDIVKYLLRTYPQAVNAQDHFKRSALHYAAGMGNNAIDYYKLLRKAGADQNIQDGDGRTPKFYLKSPESLDLEQLRMDSRTALRQALHQRVAPSYLEASIQQWMKEGNTGKLEQLVLSGCGDLLQGRQPANPESEEFLNALPSYLEKIDRIHQAVREGDTKYINENVDKVKLALARDRKGATPLHDAILYEQTEIIRTFAQSYPQVLNAPDYNKRTPLHYAAASRDGGHFYKILEKAGADPKITDNEGRTPEWYLQNPGKLNLKSIRERDFDFVVDVETDLVDRDIESRASELSAPTPDSVVGTPPSTMTNVETLGRSYNGDLMSSTASIGQPELLQQSTADEMSSLFSIGFDEKLLEAQKCANNGTNFEPSSENGKYLAKALGPVLTQAVAELVIKRPAEPIDFLSRFLFKYDADRRSLQPDRKTPEA